MLPDMNMPTQILTDFALSSDVLTSTTNAVARTLAQMYDLDTSSSAWLMYNDETPVNKKYDDYGHTKGDVAFDGSQGFWLIHSVPRFPPYTSSGSYSYPSDEVEYGQSFLCMTFATETFNSIGYQFLYNKPKVYDSNLPSSLASTVPNMQAVLNASWTSDTSNIVPLHTLGGQLLTNFAKSAAWNNELYEGLVAPKFSSDLFTETWLNGVGPLPSWCKPQYDYNVMDISDLTVGSFNYSSSKDHSKWAITSGRSGYTCIGDINRMQAQLTRGGGTVCFYNSNLYNAFNSLIKNYHAC